MVLGEAVGHAALDGHLLGKLDLAGGLLEALAQLRLVLEDLAADLVGGEGLLAVGARGDDGLRLGDRLGDVGPVLGRDVGHDLLDRLDDLLAGGLDRALQEPLGDDAPLLRLDHADLVVEVDREVGEVDHDVAVDLLRGVGQRGVVAQDPVGGRAGGVRADLVHEGLAARQQDRGEELLREVLEAVLVGRGLDHGLGDGAATRLLGADLHVLGVGEVADQKVALLEVVAAAQLLPQVLGDLVGDLDEVDLAGLVAAQRVGEARVLGEGAVLAVDALAHLAHVTLHVGLGRAVRHVELALGEVAAAALEVEGVEDRMADSHHGRSPSMGMPRSRRGW